ncbi:hypothetical protein IVB33_30275 [Bradyrhizobium sp. 24]|uniref:hypothetical protein n=1 Tax=unclassified Bradyrhizobium TaxID=2631580 RepID=UPI001FFA89C9|nr:MULTISPECIES: hypothetical protein [unclassified Bradyrhizobium]MCK1297527.1 hypothetical protein [Bradyrhizobium sp. 37]MCK1381180.1 hypothetical protein [Bradyrhizobium sp. 24]MCK1770931.1 hypothetical protein [Bradyrhizobium sp. 134]
MTDKTFKQRVMEEAESFAQIYEYFREDLEAWQAEKGLMDNDWAHLFAVPLHGSEANEPEERKKARREWKVLHKHDAAREAVQQLGEATRVGQIVIKDTRVSTALEMGYLTPNDITPTPLEGFGGAERLAKRLKPEHDDPIFWRTLLEVFCRAFTAARGRSPWPLSRMIELAFDLNDIRNGDPDKRWTVHDFCEVLRKDKEYVRVYGNHSSAAGQSGVGEDRVKQILKLIGPMDDGALRRLRDLFPDEFYKGSDRHLRRKILKGSEDHLRTVLNMAEDVNEVLDKSRTSSTSDQEGQ